jgi:hypothetical protein
MSSAMSVRVTEETEGRGKARLPGRKATGPRKARKSAALRAAALHWNPRASTEAERVRWRRRPFDVAQDRPLQNHRTLRNECQVLRERPGVLVLRERER